MSLQYAILKDPHLGTTTHQPTTWLPAKWFFYVLCINVRGSEVGSQSYLKTYGDLFILAGKGVTVDTTYMTKPCYTDAW